MGKLFVVVYHGDNFGNFLSAFPQTKSVLKCLLCMERNFLPFVFVCSRFIYGRSKTISKAFPLP